MLAALAAIVCLLTPAHAAPEGQLAWGVHVTLAPTWFDPAEAPGLLTPYMLYYALHDALVKPMPGQSMAPALAESWHASADGLVYEFVLRKSARFHNGDPVTADDVKFSLERYRGSAARPLKERIAAVETPDPGRVRIPRSFDFYWQPSAPVHDPSRARQLLAEAGYPAGFDAGAYACDISYGNLAEATANYLQAVGIRTRLRPLERAAFYKAYGEKTLRNVVQGSSGAFGNAATRLEMYVVTGGAYTCGTYPDLEGLFRDQAAETDRKKREAVPHRMQQLVHDKAIFAPIWQLAFLNGVGPRAEESGLGLIPGHAYSAPYEDLRVRK